MTLTERALLFIVKRVAESLLDERGWEWDAVMSNRLDSVSRRLGDRAEQGRALLEAIRTPETKTALLMLYDSIERDEQSLHKEGSVWPKK